MSDLKTITIPGIYKDFDEDAYFADPCPAPSLNQSLVKVLINQSALHAHEEHPRLSDPEEDEEPEKYIKAQAIGNAAHSMLIGRGKKIAVGEFSNWQTKEAKGFKADALAEGKTPILEKHMKLAHRMSLAAKLQLNSVARDEPELLKVFNEGDGEVVIACEIDGIWMRSLIDWMVNPRLLFDYKSTAMSVAPHGVPNLMANAGWQIQAATQERILDVLDPDGAGRRRFFFIAQENYRPFALTVHEITEATMTMGRKMLAMAEPMWRHAIQTGEWPSYPAKLNHPEFPAFKESQWLNREIEAATSETGRIDPSLIMAG